MKPNHINPIEYFNEWLAEPIRVTDWTAIGVLEALNRHLLARDETAQDYVMPTQRCRERDGRLRIFGENQDSYHCFVHASDEAKVNPPVYFESCLDLVIDCEIDPARVINGDHVRVAESLTQFLWHILGHYICLRTEIGPALAADVNGIVFLQGVALDAAFENPLGSEFPAGHSPFFDKDIICIPRWGAAFRTMQASQRFIARYTPPISVRWAHSARSG